MSNDIQAVVFDLADVLLEFAGPESLARLSGGRIGPAEFSRLWSSPIAHALYCGACTPHDFAVGALAQLDLPVSPGIFLDEFAAWFRGPFPGALELVEHVRGSRVVACLSNTHLFDVARFRTEFDIDRRFDRCFFSNEIGLRKPERACYQYVLDHLGFAEQPHHVLFLDDSATNMDAARAVGLRAYEVRGTAGVHGCLRSLGLLKPLAASDA